LLVYSVLITIAALISCLRVLQTGSFHGRHDSYGESHGSSAAVAQLIAWSGFSSRSNLLQHLCVSVWLRAASHLLPFALCSILQVGFNMRKVTKGNVSIKLWDLGGQPRFRSMWERYCRGVSAIV